MRIEGWERLLAEYIAAAEHVPFAWGRHDCALWAAGWVKLCTGDDFAGEWKGTYSTAAGAARLLKRLGFASVADAASARLPEAPPAFARRGDLLLNPGTDSLGVCLGREGAFVGDSGLTHAPALACPRAWRVG